MEELTILSTYDGLFGFVGELNQRKTNTTSVCLENALTLSYHSDGTPYMSYVHIPNGLLDMSKPSTLHIPRNNVAFYMTVNRSDGHPLFSMYDAIFDGNDD